MISGGTVTGRAKKCLELEDRLRTYRAREQFAKKSLSQNLSGDSISGEIVTLSSLHSKGILTEKEFAAAKARLLGI